MTALAANGPDRPTPGGGGQADTIIIRKVATLTTAEAAAFDQSTAQQLATKSAHRLGPYETVKSEAFANQRKVRVCGQPGYAFTRLEHDALQHAPQPGMSNAPMTWTDFDTYVLMLVGHDVWQAEYERVYEPGLEKKAAALIDFTANFCVQQNYS